VGLFDRRVKTAQLGVAPMKAAAGTAFIGKFQTYMTSGAEERALSIPTVSRARDLMASMIGALELKHYTRQWTGEEYEEIYLTNEPWMDQPDPDVTRNFFFSRIFSDLFLYGRAFAYVTARKADDNRPAAMTWLPASNVETPDQPGNGIYYGRSKMVEFNGVELNPDDVIQFLSPYTGLVWFGARAINNSWHLDAAADRYASLETVPGYLQQKGGETMGGEELTDLAAAWAVARKQNAIGALNDYVEFREFKNDPGPTLVELRQYQALEIARIANIPPYLVGVDTGSSMTYQNAQQARQDLYLFGARGYIDAIEQTLSTNQVLPRGRYVEFDIADYLEENAMTESVPREPALDSAD